MAMDIPFPALTGALAALVVLYLAVCIVRWVIAEHFSVPEGLKKLPGPTQFPIVGRVHDFPIKFVWFKFKQWSDKYGPIYRTTVMGKTIIVVSQESIARELLEKRSAIYSDRPSVPALTDSKSSTGTGEYLPLMGRNEYWSRQRRFAHQAISESQRAAFYGYPEIEAKRLMHQIMLTPYRWSSLIEDYTAKVISRLAWGYHEESENLKIDAWALLTQMSPAGPINNVFTALNMLPLWINPWKRDEIQRHTRQEKWFHNLQSRVRAEHDADLAPPSWTRRYLEKTKDCGFDDDREGSFAVGMLAVAGVFTIGGPFHTFFQAMVLHRHWLLKVQEELDQVVGDRPPRFSDYKDLPVLRAVIKECLRWQPAVPTGVAHELETDDEFDGYFIPKGAHILPLEWAFSRDENNYPDAGSFRPERWLDAKFPTYREPLTEHPSIIGHSLFGWGRRLCQGMSLTSHELLVGCASVAWAFDLQAKKDQHGRKIPIDLVKTNSLLIIKPDRFDIDITPRTEDRGRQIVRNWQEANVEASPAVKA